MLSICISLLIFLSQTLPSPQIHPIPTSLTNWEDISNQGDYFSQVKIPTVGALIWSAFPVTVYFDHPPTSSDSSSANKRLQDWSQAVAQAITDWSQYLSLQEVATPETADIVIRRSPPPLQANLNPQTRLLEIPRAATAQTNYQIYTNSDNPPKLLHRMTIYIDPGRSSKSLQATARHEIGHALGIWGHSPFTEDVMYFSQVRDAPPISPRDINTLKKVYQQPTRLGWNLEDG